MKVQLKRVSGARFEAKNTDGNTVILDGPAEVGGKGEGVRPMEMVLVGLAGCAAVDVLLILQKQRQALEDLDIDVEGDRVDAVPAVFSAVRLHFAASGDVDGAKLERAVALSIDKYCSVARMLAPQVAITATSSVR